MTALAVAGGGMMVLTAFLSALAQVWLKESALTAHSSRRAEFLNPRVLAAYALLSLTLALNAWALRWLDFKWLAALGSLSYVFILPLARRRFGETLTPAQTLGAGLVLLGLGLFPL